jgi:hypothetical protein
MLMKYAAVTLLIAALTTSAVLAQSPRRVSLPSPRPKGQARIVDVPVKPHTDALLRISVKASWPTDSSSFWISATVENIGDRDIDTFAIHRAAVGSEGPVHGWLPGGVWRQGKGLRPGQVVVTKPVGPYPASSLPLHTYELVSVVFTDGTSWCADVCPPTTEVRAGYLVGKRAAVERLQKVLAEGGADAVIKAVGEDVADDDLDPAVKAATGESIDVVPPGGHTPAWEYGFRSARKSVAYDFRGYVLHGTGPIESRLGRAFQAEGAK